MRNNTKKWPVAAGCLAVCAVLLALIGGSFSKDPVADVPLPAAEAAAEGVTVDPKTEPGGKDAKDSPASAAVKPDSRIPADNGAAGGAISTGTEQTIGPDVTKPEYDEETLKDPTKTPDGTPVDEPPQSVEHDSVVPPPATEKPPGGASGGLPGFDNVPELGPNEGTYADDIRENGNKIGIMN